MGFEPRSDDGWPETAFQHLIRHGAGAEGLHYRMETRLGHTDGAGQLNSPLASPASSFTATTGGGSRGAVHLGGIPRTAAVGAEDRSRIHNDLPAGETRVAQSDRR